tara:strand:- start:309 stop:1256 length:948 start_codon:yes stop_codon:yes gene_type:complete
MKRILCLTFLVTLGLVTTLVSNYAQEARFPIRALEVAQNLHVLSSDPTQQGMRTGGNTGVFITTDGIVLVDTKIKGYGADILAEVKKLSDKPITTIINTHTHWDHSGSNTEFPDTVNFVAHDNTLKHMSGQDCDDGTGFQGGSITNCESFKGDNEKFLPSTTFATQHTLFSGSDQIDLYYFGRGHTDGDIFVVYKEARTVQTGDMFARKGLPYIDSASSNGSASEFGETLRKAVGGISDIDSVITGHADDPHTWNDLVNYSGFYNDLATKAKAANSRGQSVDDFVSAYRTPAQYSDFAIDEGRLRTVVDLIYNGR